MSDYSDYAKKQRDDRNLGRMGINVNTFQGQQGLLEHKRMFADKPAPAPYKWPTPEPIKINFDYPKYKEDVKFSPYPSHLPPLTPQKISYSSSADDEFFEIVLAPLIGAGLGWLGSYFLVKSLLMKIGVGESLAETIGWRALPVALIGALTIWLVLEGIKVWQKWAKKHPH